MIKLSVNEIYPLPTPSQEGASANFLSKNGNMLQIIMHNISREELYCFKKGKIKAGFLYENGDLIWLFTFFDKKGPVFTLDAPFDVRIIPEDLLALHSITNDNQRLSIDIHVVDENNILRVLRVVTMSPKLTIELLSATQDQYISKQSGASLQNWMQWTPNQLTKKTTMYELGK